jgi:hypothetical protein
VTDRKKRGDENTDESGGNEGRIFGAASLVRAHDDDEVADENSKI